MAMITSYNVMTMMRQGRSEAIHNELRWSIAIGMQGTRESDVGQDGEGYMRERIDLGEGVPGYTRIRAGYNMKGGNQAAGVSLSIREDLCEGEKAQGSVVPKGQEGGGENIGSENGKGGT